MIDATTLTVFLTALTAVYLVPGPDMALVMATSASKGFRAGIAVTAGLAAARALHVLASSLGLAALFAQYPVLQSVVKLVGAVYLLYIAWKIISAPAPDRGDAPDSPDSPVAGSDALRGLLTNLLNPKALLFCGLFLPQFVSTDAGPLMPQFIFLGGVLVCYGVLFDLAYAALAGGLAQFLRRKTKKVSMFGRTWAKLRRWLMASVFAGIAVKLFAG